MYWGSDVLRLIFNTENSIFVDEYWLFAANIECVFW